MAAPIPLITAEFKLVNFADCGWPRLSHRTGMPSTVNGSSCYCLVGLTLVAFSTGAVKMKIAQYPGRLPLVYWKNHATPRSRYK
jgi:hypothetical protein